MAADRSVVGQIRADADTSYSYLSSFEFVFVLCMMKEILEITEGLGQALQLRSQDIVNDVRLVFATKECLRNLRSDDGWEQIFFTVVEFRVDHGTEIPNMEETYIMRGGRARHQPDHFTKEQYFRVEVFRATIDCQLHELDRRFNEKIMDLLSTSATLIPRNIFKSFKGSDICGLVKKYYPADFTQQDIYGLEQQLKPFVVDASNDEELKNISTLTNLCHSLVETGRDNIYNLIVRLLQLLVKLPVSTASAERAFSSLKIVKTRLRNKMADENLANNLVVHIEREIAEKYDFEAVLTEFKGKGDQKADLGSSSNGIQVVLGTVQASSGVTFQESKLTVTCAAIDGIESKPVRKKAEKEKEEGKKIIKTCTSCKSSRGREREI
uniref:Uncharacterized protein n=1 Tax=Avena sativa TaxID=4498 RepID=A0ACD5X541_AVESA